MNKIFILIEYPLDFYGGDYCPVINGWWRDKPTKEDLEIILKEYDHANVPITEPEYELLFTKGVVDGGGNICFVLEVEEGIFLKGKDNEIVREGVADCHDRHKSVYFGYGEAVKYFKHCRDENKCDVKGTECHRCEHDQLGDKKKHRQCKPIHSEFLDNKDNLLLIKFKAVPGGYEHFNGLYIDTKSGVMLFYRTSYDDKYKDKDGAFILEEMFNQGFKWETCEKIGSISTDSYEVDLLMKIKEGEL